MPRASDKCQQSRKGRQICRAPGASSPLICLASTGGRGKSAVCRGPRTAATTPGRALIPAGVNARFPARAPGHEKHGPPCMGPPIPFTPGDRGASRARLPHDMLSWRRGTGRGGPVRNRGRLSTLTTAHTRIDQPENLGLMVGMTAVMSRDLPIQSCCFVTQQRCTAGLDNHSTMVQTWSASPAATAGLRSTRRPSASLTASVRTGQAEPPRSEVDRYVETLRGYARKFGAFERESELFGGRGGFFEPSAARPTTPSPGAGRGPESPRAKMLARIKELEAVEGPDAKESKADAASLRRMLEAVEPLEREASRPSGSNAPGNTVQAAVGR